MPNVLIVSEALRNGGGKHVDLLRQAGHELCYPRVPALRTPEDLLQAMAECHAVLAANEPYTDELMAALPNLRVIARCGVGYDSVDVEAATRRGIAVTIAPMSNYAAVAEHTFALLLAVTRLVVKTSDAVRQGQWPRRHVMIPLRGKTLGIIGLGRIGKAVAARAAGFGLRTIGYEKFPDSDAVQALHIELVDLDTLFEQSDFVTLHVPLTDETRGVINAATLARMKPGSVLVNTARGPLVDEPALVEALTSGHLAGAGLDVLVQEPPPADHPLLKLENVIVTPHVASFDSQAIEDMAVGAAASIVELYRGNWPADAVVNPQVRTAWKP